MIDLLLHFLNVVAGLLPACTEGWQSKTADSGGEATCHWVKMGLRYPDQLLGRWFFITSTFKEWRGLGDIPGFYDSLGESLTFCIEKYDAALAGYVFMPSHVHIVVGIDGKNLGDMMRDFKKFTGRKVAKAFGLEPSIWMPRYDRLVIASEKVMRVKLHYCHENPVKAGLAIDAPSWKWSSASDYFGDVRGPLPVFRAWC